jgi:hypothetical protein
MRLRTNASIRAVAQAGLECRPPLGATLRMRKHAVLVYLPKYCILDRKVARQAGLGPSH